MRLTRTLFRQHIGWHFDRKWHLHGKRKILKTNTEEVLVQKGLPVYRPEDLLTEKREFQRVEIIGYGDKKPVFDETHPDYHTRRLLSYRDHNVLLEGVQQAKLLTKTVELQQGLPARIVLPDLSKDVNRFCKKIILNSHVFDAEQKRLPKIKDPLRPAHNFARVFGITKDRSCKLITSKLLNLIESTSDYNLAKDRFLFNDLNFSYVFEGYGDLINFQSSVEALLTSNKPLKAITSENTADCDLPDMHPILPTVSLTEDHIYVAEDIFPLHKTVLKNHPHTIVLQFNEEFVKNLYEEPVTDTQIRARSLMKSFTVAASYAKHIYGNEVKQLPKPVALQCIQTDGKFFHFSIFQLNTLDLEGREGAKNVFYQTDLMNLFERCCYDEARPVLEGYNSEVVKHLYSFYNNI